MCVFRKSILLIFCLFFTGILYAQVSFTTKSSASKIAKNELLEIEYEIQNGNIEDFSQPDFSDWEVVSGPNVSSSTVISNGDKTTSMSYSFMLKPLKPGQFKIPGAKAFINGKQVSSNAVAITVTNSTVANPQASSSQGSLLDPLFTMPPEPAPQENLSDYDGYLLKENEDILAKTKKNLFAVAEVSKKTCYPGEALKAVYKLYSRVNMDAHITKRPSFSGFSSIDIPDSTNREYEIVERNGKQFKVYTIRSAQLYPLLTGLQTLQPVEIESKIQYRKIQGYSNSGQYDPYTSSSLVDYPYLIKSDSVHVEVLPFPEKDKPAEFNGVTGNFKISTSLASATLDRNEAGSVKIEITGSGNWAMVQAPVIKWPAGIDVYEPGITESLDSQAIPVMGKRVYTYPFSTDKAGKVEIPPVKFAFFNPAGKRYETITATIPAIKISNKLKAVATPVPEYSSGLSGIDNTQIFTDIVSIAFPVAALLLVLWLLIKNRRRKFKRTNDFLKPQLYPKKTEPIAPLIVNETFGRFMPPVSSSRQSFTEMPEILKPSFQDSGIKQQSIDFLVDPFASSQHYFSMAKEHIYELLAKERGIREMPVAAMRTQLLEQGFGEGATEKIFNLLETCEHYRYSPFAENYDRHYYDSLVLEVDELIRNK